MTSNEKQKQKYRQNALAIVFTMPSFFAILNVVLSSIGLTRMASASTAFIYIVILLYILLKCGVNRSGLLILALFYIAFLLNYWLFSSTRSELTSQGMLILYFFFAPYCCLCFVNIRIG